jgi:integrase
MSKRRQTHLGSITERSGKWYIRFYRDGKQVTEYLAEKDERFFSKTCKPLATKAAEHMAKVHKSPRLTATAGNFWTSTYEPFVAKHRRPSTLESYTLLWTKYLKPSLENVAMGEWRPSDGTRLLTRLAEAKMGQRNLQHVKNLASGMWSHAVALGECESNIWRDAKSLVKPRPPGKTTFYSLDEAKAVINSLAHRTDAQLAVSLSFFCGMRAGEIRGLKWEDCADGHITIRRAVVRGKVGDTKTPEAQDTIPAVGPTAALLLAWNEKCGEPKEGWVFENSKKKPASLQRIARETIREAAKKAGVKWTGFQAGRRGVATLLTTLTGVPQAASQMLRHKTMAVTMGNYVKDDRRALAAGVKLLEAENEKKKD